jgi:hypothetical protein
LAGKTLDLYGPPRSVAEVIGLLELSIDHLGECGWMLADWDRWSMSKKLVPILRSLKQRRAPDVRDVDRLFDQLAAFQERYDAEALDSAMHCLLAARASMTRFRRDAQEREV